jgi:hypothetical protein
VGDVEGTNTFTQQAMPSRNSDLARSPVAKAKAQAERELRISRGCRQFQDRVGLYGGVGSLWARWSPPIVVKPGFIAEIAKPDTRGSSQSRDRLRNSFVSLFRRLLFANLRVPIEPHNPTLSAPLRPHNPADPPHRADSKRPMSSLSVSRAVLRRQSAFTRTFARRNASQVSEAASSVKQTSSDVAASAKDRLSPAASKASQGLSRVASSAGNLLNSAGSALGNVGGRTGRLIGAVQSMFWIERKPLKLRCSYHKLAGSF